MSVRPLPVTSVQVSAPSRLHFGLLSFGHPEQAQFGGAGVMVDTPRVELTVSPEKDFVVAYGPWSRRIAEVAQMWSRRRLGVRAPRVRISVKSCSDFHCGLGTGTQLALSLATALNQCYQLDEDTIDERAQLVERGHRSAVGTYGFLFGGFIVEFGRMPGQRLAPLGQRLSIPESWSFLLIRLQGPPGRSGVSEQRAFERLPPVPPQVTQRLMRLLSEEMVPAVKSQLWDSFGEAVYEFGRLSGECFSLVQGGAYASPRIAEVIEWLRSREIPGVGQTSWGPTVFAILNSTHDPQTLAAELWSRFPLDLAKVWQAQPDNQGARVREVGPTENDLPQTTESILER